MHVSTVISIMITRTLAMMELITGFLTKWEVLWLPLHCKWLLLSANLKRQLKKTVWSKASQTRAITKEEDVCHADRTCKCIGVHRYVQHRYLLENEIDCQNWVWKASKQNSKSRCCKRTNENPCSWFWKERPTPSLVGWCGLFSRGVFGPSS